MNMSTAITLNDRFSMIKKQPSNTSIPESRRSRSRSRSRNGRNNQKPDLRGSRRNQQLLNKLEQQHKLRMALKLKNKSLMASRGRVQAANIRNRFKRANVIKKTMNRQRLRRSNSLTTFIPLNDAPSRLRQGRSRSRSRSRNPGGSQVMQNAGSVHDRLGIRTPRRMRRGGQQNNNMGGPQQQRGRSRSRQRLNRNNFRNTATPVRRSNSVNARLGNNGPVQVQQQQNQANRRRRFRSRSRNNNNNNNNIRNNNGNRNVNNRNANNNPRFRNQLNRPMTGRIVKRKINRKTGVTTQRVRNVAARNVKKLQRGNNNNNNGQARNGRARNRGQRNNQGGQQQPRRGRSRTRRANRGKPQVSKEQLDKQLDAYMAKGSA